MNTFSIVGRSELKYYFLPELIQEIRDFIAPYACLDPYSTEIENNSYTVRSIYFDTVPLDFYYEKLDGLKIRKKIRVRAYNEYDPDKPAFLEIKRRYNNLILKERAKIPLSQMEEIHQCLEYPSNVDNKWINNQKTIEKYLYNIKTLNLRPTALITYEREAYVGSINNHERVTFDKNIRSLIFPEMKELFRENDLKFTANNLHILELKFESFMPKWMNRLVRELRLRAEPIPKYCMSIDSWLNKQDSRTEISASGRVRSYA